MRTCKKQGQIASDSEFFTVKMQALLGYISSDSDEEGKCAELDQVGRKTSETGGVRTSEITTDLPGQTRQERSVLLRQPSHQVVTEEKTSSHIQAQRYIKRTYDNNKDPSYLSVKRPSKDRFIEIQGWSARTSNTSASNITSKSGAQPTDTTILHGSRNYNIDSNITTKPYVSKRQRNNANQSELPSEQHSDFIGPLPRTESKVNSHSKDHSDFIGPVLKQEVLGKISRESVNNRAPKKMNLNFEAHTKGVNRVKWNPVHVSLLVSCSMDQTVAIWETYPAGVCRKRHTLHKGAVKDVKWSPCGSQILSCGYDKCARLVDLETGSEVAAFLHRDYVTCVQYHPVESNVFLSGSSRTGIKSWDVRTDKVIASYQASFGQVQDLAFLPSGQEFFSAAEVIRRNSTDKGIMAWDYRTTAILSNQIYQEAFTCTSLKVHPSGTHFMAQSNGNYLAIFSTKKPYKLNKHKRYEGHKVSAYWIGSDFSPDGSLVLSGSADGDVYVYNHQTSHVIRSLSGHSGVCMDVAFHPTLSSTVASCDWNSNIIIWN